MTELVTEDDKDMEFDIDSEFVNEVLLVLDILRDAELVSLADRLKDEVTDDVCDGEADGEGCVDLLGDGVLERLLVGDADSVIDSLGDFEALGVRESEIEGDRDREIDMVFDNDNDTDTERLIEVEIEAVGGPERETDSEIDFVLVREGVTLRLLEGDVDAALLGDVVLDCDGVIDREEVLEAEAESETVGV